jgi:Matrixin
MNRKTHLAAWLILSSLLFIAVPMRSEGPLLVGGPAITGFPSAEGLPYSWSITSSAFNSSTKTLSYWTDQGGLGGVSNADSLVASAFAAWSGVSTANINFLRAGQLGDNVTGANAVLVFNAVENCTTLPNDPAGGIGKPVTIAYDSDGSIITKLGGDARSTLGEATALCPTSNGTNNSYRRGEAILNGSTNLGTAELKTVMIHEFGHMLGLDHTQINLDCLNHTTACMNDGSIAGVPIMFPVLLQDKTVPTTDDVAAISTLYPVTGSSPPTGKTLFSSLGEIQGRVLFSDSIAQAQGFNVIARNVSNPRVVAVSNLSGYRFTEDAGNDAIPTSHLDEPFFSHNQAVIGFFDIPGLPPGDYTIEVEAVNDVGLFPFVGGSSIGPVGSNLGFQYPLPGSCTVHQFYNTSPGDDPCTSGTPVTVPAASSQVITGIDISLKGTNPSFDAWEDGP